MRVESVVDLGDGHLIEFGRATWDDSAESIRNRYPTSTGGFSPRSSSEFPIEDLEHLIIEAARRDKLPVTVCAHAIAALAESVMRQASQEAQAVAA